MRCILFGPVWCTSVALLVAANLQTWAADPNFYRNSRFRYELEVPRNWHLSEPDSGVATLFNFDPRRGGPQGLFPEHGAEIYVIPLAAVRVVTNLDTVDDWLRANITADHTAVSVMKLTREERDENAPQNLVQVQADFERDPQDQALQREVDYYFTLRGAPFRLMLLYWKGDQRARRYRLAFESVVHSIRYR